VLAGVYWVWLWLPSSELCGYAGSLCGCHLIAVAGR
jgi:hypothetical protein